MFLPYRYSPEPPPPGMLPPGFENKVMHAGFRIGGDTLMASDGCGEAPGLSGFSLSFTVSTEVEADRVFAALADGGQVQMPLTRTFWMSSSGESMQTEAHQTEHGSRFVCVNPRSLKGYCEAPAQMRDLLGSRAFCRGPSE
jgi:uncharacterized glyoxalase superfamily protein PhnB